MKSKKALFRLLGDRFEKMGVRIGVYGISDETYGRDSRIYLWNIKDVWGMSRNEFEDLIAGWGFKVNRKYGRGCGLNRDYDATEVQVSFFKGWHWDV